ncbi:hypothetical protein NP233_g1799 [Leucocoprinus birnbaumii]|uniref:Protein kinase domain-containing protein n=1 Tax=Leucocoprinus birnbaumii TaxID=56174 RepID=A0AAD5VZV7_9AGAR|nr:hypothetical protein NP233_g1799 [Leucocoprinus birnbaumii]
MASTTSSTGTTTLKPVIRDLIDIRRAAQYSIQVLGHQEPLGEGAFGRVYRGQALIDSCVHDVVIKHARYSKDSPKSPRDKITRLLREILSWRHLHHPNIASFHGLDFSSANVDLIQSIDLSNQDPSRQLRLPGLISPYIEYAVLEYVALFPHERFNCVKGLAKGLTYIHQNLIVHGDIRPENVRTTPQGVLKLTDFGLSRLQDCRGFTTEAYTNLPPRFTAPEILAPANSVPTKPTFKSDIYSFSMCMLQILSHPDAQTTSEPFNHLSTTHGSGSVIIYACVKKSRPLRANYPPVLTDAYWNLMSRCWQHEESERPNMHSVLEGLLGGVKCTNATGPCWLWP